MFQFPLSSSHPRSRFCFPRTRLVQREMAFLCAPLLASSPKTLSQTCVLRRSRLQLLSSFRSRHRRSVLQMTQKDTDDNKNSNNLLSDKPKNVLTSDDPDDAPLSVWGVTSFAIIFIIFALAILASLARDFIPGGMVNPA